MRLNYKKLKDDLVSLSILPMMIYFVSASLVTMLAILGLNAMQKLLPHALGVGGYDLLWNLLLIWPFTIMGQLIFYIYLYIKYFEKPKKTYPKGYKLPKRSLKERLLS